MYTIDLPYTTHSERLQLLMSSSTPTYIDVYTTVGCQLLGIYPTWVERRRTSFE